MPDNTAIKKFLSNLSRDDYVSADKDLPKVVESALHNVINKRKAAILDAVNTEMGEAASNAIKNSED